MCSVLWLYFISSWAECLVVVARGSWARGSWLVAVRRHAGGVAVDHHIRGTDDKELREMKNIANGPVRVGDPPIGLTWARGAEAKLSPARCVL